MKAIGRFLTTVVLLANLLLLAGLSTHVVRSGKTVKVLFKDHLTLIDTYNDVSNWTPADAARHPMVVDRALATGHADLLPALSSAH